MILKEFYLDKKERIETEMSFSGFIPSIALYNETIFKKPIKTPMLLFKYNAVDWKISSEENRIAEVSFSIYIILPIENVETNLQECERVFDFSNSIDKAILSDTKSIGDVATSFAMMSSLKVKEKQCSNLMYNHFVWELTYKTILAETNDKNLYSLIHKTPMKSQNHTRVERFSGPFISLEDQKIYEIINTSFNNN